MGSGSGRRVSSGKCIFARGTSQKPVTVAAPHLLGQAILLRGMAEKKTFTFGDFLGKLVFSLSTTRKLLLQLLGRDPKLFYGENGEKSVSTVTNQVVRYLSNNFPTPPHRLV